MTQRQKIWGNIALFVVVFGLTIYGVLRGEDLNELGRALSRCRGVWLLPAAACILLFIGGEATVLWLALRSYGMGLRGWECFLISSVGVFFNAVTPSAVGGQPMQVYFLRRRDVPVSVSSVLLMVMTIAYKLVLVTIGLAVCVFSHSFLCSCLEGAMLLFYLGLVLAVGFTAFLLLLVFHPQLARAIVVWGMGLLEKLHIVKDRSERQASLDLSMARYRETAAYLRHNPWLIAGTFVLTFLRRVALFSVTWFVYRAMGLTGYSWLSIVVLQAVISVCADMLPLPGGMGISEGLFLKIFAPAFGALVLPGVVLSRGLGHYGQLIFCGFLSLAAVFLLRRAPRNRHYDDRAEAAKKAEGGKL